MVDRMEDVMRRVMAVMVMAAATLALVSGMAADAKPKRTPRPTPAPTLRTADSPMPIDRPAEVCLSVRAATANLTPGAFADAIARGAVIVTAVVPCPAVATGPSSSPAATPTPRATPRPLPTPAAVTKSGNGDSRTGPFALSGGDYRIDVAVRSEGGEFDAGCVHFGTLMSTDGSVREEGGDAEAGPNAASTGMTYVYGLPAGTYYFDISSLCRWTVTIRPA